MRRENSYQARLIKKLEHLLPGCLILKNDSHYLQGIPDLTIFYRDKWAMLEVKRSANETFEPNQEWYLDQLDAMSFAACIFPENEEEVLDALQSALKPRRSARVSQR